MRIRINVYQNEKIKMYHFDTFLFYLYFFESRNYFLGETEVVI